MNAPRDLALNCTAIKAAYRQSKDGFVVVSFRELARFVDFARRHLPERISREVSK